jgi:hypothetical protein
MSAERQRQRAADHDEQPSVNRGGRQPENQRDQFWRESVVPRPHEPAGCRRSRFGSPRTVAGGQTEVRRDRSQRTSPRLIA